MRLTVTTIPSLGYGMKMPSLNLNDLLLKLTKMLRPADVTSSQNPLYKKLIETSPVGHYQLDTSGKCTFISNTVVAMVGAPEEKILGGAWQNYIHPDDKQSVLAEVHRAIDNREPYALENRLLREDGSIWWVLSKGQPYYDGHNQFMGYLGTLSDITHAKGLEEKLKELSCYDALTCLPNSMLFDHTLDESVSAANRYGERFALLYIDVDDFNKINTAKGHTFGDQLLILIGERLQGVLRKHDFVAKMSGDAFAILMRKFKAEGDVAAMASRILEKIQEPYMLDDESIHLSVSIGISLYPGKDSDDETMKKRANSALARAKSKGRNNYQFYSQKIQEKVQAQVKIENLLHTAIDNDELHLVYQPQVDSKSHRITAYEVLLRWDSPILGNVGPSVFIPIAENSRLVDSIGKWVMKTALHQHKLWQDKFGAQGFDDVLVSINVSPAQMLGKNMAQDFLQMISESGVPHDKIMLEVTETTYIRDPDVLRETLEIFRSHGTNIGIDDFGTGYSSLNVIEQLPIHFLKIDTSFVKNLFVTKHNIAIIKAVCSLSKNLGFDVVAEGVENEEQAKILQHTGCDTLQGYLFSKPLQAEDFEAYFLDNLQTKH